MKYKIVEEDGVRYLTFLGTPNELNRANKEFAKQIIDSQQTIEKLRKFIIELLYKNTAFDKEELNQLNLMQLLDLRDRYCSNYSENHSSENLDIKP